ncbi:MAG: transposase [Minisyncoccia bacterium]
MRNIRLAEGEFYHVYNRGVDKRVVFSNKKDFDRFLEGMKIFNTKENVGNLTRHSSTEGEEKLVDFVAYCINSNHFHFLITPLTEKGLEKFMHKLCMGYSKYFNAKYHRSGALFQGKFKAIHVDTNEYLLHLSAYVNLNEKVHRHEGNSRSSWEEYAESATTGLCKKDIILGQFKNRGEYVTFAKKALKHIVDKKLSLKDLESNSYPLTLGVNIKIKK